MKDWIYRYTPATLRSIEECYWQAYTDGIQFGFDATCYNPFGIAEYLADFDNALRNCDLVKKFNGLRAGKRLWRKDIDRMCRYLNGESDE